MIYIYTGICSYIYESTEHNRFANFSVCAARLRRWPAGTARRTAFSCPGSFARPDGMSTSPSLIQITLTPC